MENRGKDLPERTYQYGRRVIHLYESLPSTKLAQHIGFQLLRSATSVGANYREADRARSKPEFIAKLGDCLKELDESSLWLQHIHDSELVIPDRLKEIRQETDELIRIFVTIIKRSKGE